jgi:hypothetical protein
MFGQSIHAVAGDGNATVSWLPPRSSGSFAVSHYEVTTVEGDSVCLVATSTDDVQTCLAEKLNNGQTYEFQVQALTGAGWGAMSEPSNAVTPRALSLVITGTRREVRGRPGIRISGTSTGVDMGAIVRPWIRFPGQSRYTLGSARILVDETDDLVGNVIRARRRIFTLPFRTGLFAPAE